MRSDAQEASIPDRAGDAEGPVEGLRLSVSSFADMTMERALNVGRVFDAHPTLRPLKVGGDPPRLKVDESMERLMARIGLPVEWSTYRRTGETDYEMGDITMLPGRGGWGGIHTPAGWELYLTGNRIDQKWSAATMGNEGSYTDVADFFEDLVIASDAAYGIVLTDSMVIETLKPSWAGANRPTRNLSGAFWLNYFGPAFLTDRPSLATLPGARVLSTGGVLVQTAPSPWRHQAGTMSSGAKELLDLLGPEALEYAVDNPALPSADNHVAASPGTMAMPWVGWESDKLSAARSRKHITANRRLVQALDGRSEPTLASDAIEWSSSLDADVWKRFAIYLSKALGGDLSGAIGKSLLAVIANAPPGDEGAVLVDTQLGVVSFGWFISDPETVHAYIFGAPQVGQLCQDWFQE